jgi:hypothetical protein
MADYYTHFCFIIPASAAQVQWLFRLHDAACRLLAAADVDRVASKILTRDAAIFGPARDLAERFADHGQSGLEIHYEPADGGARVLSADGCGNAEYAAALAHLFLRHFGIDQVVALQWSLTCSEPRPDGFGGGAAMISRHRITLFDTHRFLAEAMRREQGCLEGRSEERVGGPGSEDGPVKRDHVVT